MKAGFLFDEGAASNPARRGHAFGNRRPRLARGRHCARLNRALGQGIGLAIAAEQGGDQQGATKQALGIAKRRHRHIDLGSRCRKGGQAGRDHDGGDILGIEIGIAGIDAQTLQHGLKALFGEGGVSQGVARTVQADHNAISDQLVVANTLERDNILDP